MTDRKGFTSARVAEREFCLKTGEFCRVNSRNF